MKTNIDSFIKEQIAELEGVPAGIERNRSHTWDRIQQELDQKPARRPLWGWMAAAGLALLATLSFLLVQRQEPVNLAINYSTGDSLVVFTQTQNPQPIQQEQTLRNQDQKQNEPFLTEKSLDRGKGIMPQVSQSDQSTLFRNLKGRSDQQYIQNNTVGKLGEQMHLNTKWESSNFAFQDQVTSGTTLSSNQSFSSVNSTVSVPNGQSGAYTYQWSPNTSGVILPSSGTYQVGVITGGTPAEYGDLTGGVVSMNVIGNGVKTNQSEPVGLGLTTPSTVTVDGNLVALFSNDGEKAKQKQGWEDPNAVEEYAPIYENSFLAVQQEPLSTFSIDVDRASYANMRRFLNSNQLPAPDVIRIEEMVNYFHYDYKEPKDQHPFNVITEVSTCPWQPDHRLVHIGLQGKKIQTDNLPATNLVFLIDVSGSMDSEDKLGLLKQSFTLLTEQLRKQDRVAMVVYAGAAGVVLPSTPGDQKETILNALNNLTAGGSTAGGAGIELAYKIAKDNFIPGGNNRIVLATDGDFNVGINSESGLEDLIVQKRKGGVFLSVLGFGMGNYKDSKMEILADKGNGNYAYIDGLMEAQKTLVSEFGGTMFAIAKDVKLQIEFNPAQVKGYRLIGYENRALRNEDFANDKIDAGELGEGHTVTALYEIIPAGSKEEIPGFEPLKYQSQQNWGNSSDEMLTVKLRYKKPDGEKSILLAHELVDDKQGIIQSSNNFRWSAAVASFGMVLRGSAHKGQSNCDLVLKLAQSAAGKDAEGYRAEFITLVQKAKLLMELKNVEVRDK